MIPEDLDRCTKAGWRHRERLIGDRMYRAASSGLAGRLANRAHGVAAGVSPQIVLVDAGFCAVEFPVRVWRDLSAGDIEGGAAGDR